MPPKFKNLGITIVLLFLASSLQGQVLISLIFGDKLNSDKIEFGLEGGLINSTLTNLENSDRANGFNLGFYFDFKIDRKLFIHTGVIVKSPLGAKGIDVYPTGDADLDLTLENGKVSRKLRYFNVPVLFKYKFHNGFFVEGGTQLGLLTKAFDEFGATSPEVGGDVRYKTSIKDETTTLDMGVALGLGFKFSKKDAVKFGLRYYQGFVDVFKGKDGLQANSGLYVYAGIPIGVEKARKRREAEKINN